MVKAYQVFFLLCAFAVIGIFIYFTWATDKPKFRMAVLECQKNLIYDTEGDADFLILGSSRTMQGVDPVVLADQFGDKVIAVNLGRSWRGNGQFFHMARDFIETHKIKRSIVLELSFVSYTNNRSLTYANGYYPNYTLVTRSSDFAMDFISTPRDPFYLRVRDYMMNHIDLVDTRLNRFFDGRYLEDWSLWSPLERKKKIELMSESCFKKDNKSKASVLRKKEKSILAKHANWSDVKNMGWDLDVINNDRHSYYIQELKKLADANGIDFFLMLVPGYWEPPQAQAFIDAVEKKYDVPLIVPDTNIRHSIYEAQGFTDTTHMGAAGRTLFSSWLGKRLKELQHEK